MSKRTVPCPVCKKQAVWEANLFRPFCSEACKNRDLGNWATEAYRVPVEDEWEKEGEPEKSEKPAWEPKVIPGGKDDPSDED